MHIFSLLIFAMATCNLSCTNAPEIEQYLQKTSEQKELVKSDKKQRKLINYDFEIDKNLNLEAPVTQCKSINKITQFLRKLANNVDTSPGGALISPNFAKKYKLIEILNVIYNPENSVRHNFSTLLLVQCNKKTNEQWNSITCEPMNLEFLRDLIRDKECICAFLITRQSWAVEQIKAKAIAEELEVCLELEEEEIESQHYSNPISFFISNRDSIFCQAAKILDNATESSLDNTEN